jgi:hypothetical protein
LLQQSFCSIPLLFKVLCLGQYCADPYLLAACFFLCWLVKWVLCARLRPSTAWSVHRSSQRLVIASCACIPALELDVRFAHSCLHMLAADAFVPCGQSHQTINQSMHHAALLLH